MAISTVSDYLAKLNAPDQVVHSRAGSVTPRLGRLTDGFTFMWAPGTSAAAATPTTAVALTNSSTGAMETINGTSGIVTCIGATLGAPWYGAYCLVDRLSHQGGLSGTVATTQTTNLPTAALTRYTSGVGVMAGLTIYAAVGSTGTTVTASYTNQAGTAGRTTQAVVFGSTAANTVGTFVPFSLESGDTGVRSVESVTVLATTGTAGNFGVTLFKPLQFFVVDEMSGVTQADLLSTRFLGGLPEIVDDAYLSFMYIGSSTSTAAMACLKLTEH